MENEMNIKGNIFTITSSFGYNTIHKLEHTIDEYLSMADKALYEAKRTGRNKVVEY